MSGLVDRGTGESRIDFVPEAEKFRLGTAVTTLPDNPIAPERLPHAGDVVLTGSGERVELIERLGGGGEGDVYSTDGDFVAKIYNDHCCTARRRAKIELMVSKRVRCPGICFPVAALYTARREFVGFLMPRAAGRELDLSVMKPKLLKKYFPDWMHEGKVQTVTLCLTILEKIKYLHDRNIILGDINPKNFLVVSASEVYLVDTDSYQVGEFPCPVGTATFTPPELQRVEYKTLLRTPGNENFAVATLLFMIMLPGKPPYSQQGGEDISEAIREGSFPYTGRDQRSYKNTPSGSWRYMWSHMPPDVKKAFYETFQRGQKFYDEPRRLGVDAWMKIFSDYLDLLRSEKFRRADAMSLELFPNRFKKSPRSTYVVCRRCGREVAAGTVDSTGVCRDCRGRAKNRAELERRYSKVVQTRRCSVCGKTFMITAEDVKEYRARGEKLPTICENCRAAGVADPGIPELDADLQRMVRTARSRRGQSPSWHQPDAHRANIWAVLVGALAVAGILLFLLLR